MANPTAKQLFEIWKARAPKLADGYRWYLSVLNPGDGCRYQIMLFDVRGLERWAFPRNYHVPMPKFRHFVEGMLAFSEFLDQDQRVYEGAMR